MGVAEGAQGVPAIPAAVGGTTVICAGHIAHQWGQKEVSWLRP